VKQTETNKAIILPLVLYACRTQKSLVVRKENKLTVSEDKVQRSIYLDVRKWE